MQLVAYGAQDVYLTGNPQISFFKVAYRRHTNFAMEAIEQTFNGNPQLGNRVTATINRNGDLITNMWLEVEFKEDTTANVVNSLGHAMIEYIELEIGGQRIDKHYGEWFEIWSELTMSEEKRNGFKEMIGRRDAGVTSPLESNKLYIPLQFFFCRNPGLALPLIALQYHEVKINIEIETFKNCTYNGTAYVKDSDVPLANIKSIKTVKELCEKVISVFGKGQLDLQYDKNANHEASILHLNCDKSNTKLNWYPTWDFDVTIKKTVDWYIGYINGVDSTDLTMLDINEFLKEKK